MNVLRYSYESKLASAAVVAMLALSGIFAAFLIIPRVTAASGPTLTASSTSVKYNSFVTLTGSGFAPNKDITVKVGGQTQGTTFIFAGVNSLFDYGPAFSPVTDADGYFQTVIRIKDNPGGSLTITASDGTNTASTTVTMNPSLKVIELTAPFTNSGFPGQSVSLAIIAHGFAKGETVSVTSILFPSQSPSCTTGSTGGCTVSSLSSPFTFTVPDITGGTKTITATGGTSGLTATSTFTVMSYLAFYTTQTSLTTFGVLATQPTVVYVEGHGFPAGTISANNMTIGGVSTTMPSVTVGSSGAFGVGAGAHIAVSPNSNLPFGPLTIKYDGMTFNWQNGNILLSSATWGGTLIGSVVGKQSQGTGIVVLDSPSYMPDAFGGTPVGVFGYGFYYNGATTVTITPPSGLTCGTTSLPVDDSGAVFESCTLSDAAYGTYTVTASGGGVANVISPSYSIIPWIDLSGGNFDPTVTITVDAATSLSTAVHNAAVAYYGGGDNLVRVHGFHAGTVTLSVAGSNLPTTINVGTNGAGFVNDGDILDLAGGTYNLVATDNALTPASATFAGAITVVPLVAFTTVPNPTPPPANLPYHTALTVYSGPAGTQTVLRSGTDGVGQPFGVHGLAPNTKYTVTFGITPGSPVVATFTTNSAGQIPGAGVQFTVPTGTTGFHILGIWQNGTDALFGSVLMDEHSHFQWVPGSPAQNWEGQYGDLLFYLSANIQLSPTGGGVGTVVTVSGNALAAGTTYYVWLFGEGVYRATFTSTSTGSVPAGVNFTFPAEFTAPGNENGTAYTVCVGTASQFQSGNCVNFAFFVLHATASLNTTTASPGQTVTVSALGLVAGAPYTVVFNKQVVATFFANSVGSGSATFTVPTGTAPGTYQVKIFESYGLNKEALLTPPTLTVSSGATVTTQSLTPSTPTQTTLNGQPAVAVSYTNTLSVSVTAVVYAVVTNSAGQVVYYTTATIQPSPGQSQTAYAVLAGLAHGTYTVTLFAIVNNQVASTTTTTQVTI